MNGYEIVGLCFICWGVGFGSAWLYAALKMKELINENRSVRLALDAAVDTIMAQSNEIHSILKDATKRGSELVN